MRDQSRTAYGMVAPWLLGLTTLVAYPFVISIWWSFCRYDLLNPPQFIGLENYQRIAKELAHGDGVSRALWNTLYFAALSVPLSIILGLALAAVLSWQVKFQQVYRTLCYLPSVVPIVASSILWIELLNPRDGWLAHGLQWMGLPSPGWFEDYREAAWIPGWFQGTGGLGSKDALTLMTLWGVGNWMVIYLATLRDIPGDIWEAAALDGAGRVTRIWHIGLPLVTPVIFFNLVMGFIQAFQAFTPMYVISDGTGGPERSLLSLPLHLFLSAFSDLNMGYASALAWLNFVILAIITAILFRSARYWVFYRGPG